MRRLLHLRRRSGATLVELLLFMAILAAVGIAMFPLLFSATEDRLLQQTVSAVEQNGVQIMQTIGYHVHHAERVVMPGIQSSGSLLILQTASGATNPTVVGLSTGSLILVQRTSRQTLSSSQVAIESFTVENTSTSTTRGSIRVRFRLSRTIRLQAPRKYAQSFEGVFTTFPLDEPRGGACGCAQPGCAGPTSVVWQVCESGTCQTVQSEMQCP